MDRQIELDLIDAAISAGKVKRLPRGPMPEETAARAEELLQHVQIVQAKPKKDALARFQGMTKLSKRGCLLWTGYRTPSGYPRFKATPTEAVYAHKWIWEQTNGPISWTERLRFCPHHRHCVNVSHMRLVGA